MKTGSPTEQKRLDAILRGCLLGCYNTAPRRYKRALHVLLHVRSEVDGSICYTEAEARQVLEIMSPSLPGLIREASRATRSDSARANAKSGIQFRQRERDRLGRFEARRLHVEWRKF
jgi:hypothetical protein